MSNHNKSWYKKKYASSTPRNKLNEVSSLDTEPSYGYYGFKLYYPDEASIDVKEIIEKLGICIEFIERNIGTFTLNVIEKEKAFRLDYKLICEEDELLSKWLTLKSDIVKNTEYCLNCFGLAMHQTICKDFISKTDDHNAPKCFIIGKIRARLENYEPIIQLKDMKVNYYGKLATVRGTVIKAGTVKIQCQYMAFSCNLCAGLQLVKQNDGVHTLPTKCLSKGCRASSHFITLHSSPYTKTINWQALKIQELVGDEQYENGRTPRTLDCELTEDLVNCCMPGDDITITGVIKVQKGLITLKSNQPSLFSLYLDAVSVINNKNHSQGSYGASERITFNINDYYAIQKIHAEPMLFRYLVQSLCPNIYGHEVVKAGFVLALFGGTKSDTVRAESHVLVVGDPGLGKSQMLQACTNVAPRGIYVCGNTSTNSGLTVTLTRETGSEYALEAGALMLADQGCCCIDEFDKMPTQHACLLEAMEQQTISIAKAGTVCTLPTRATILAAANPAGGHYNKAKTIAENLKISSPMLSRFDLIFILLDNPNEELDMLLSKQVLAVHSKSETNNPLSGGSSNLAQTPADQTTIMGRLKLQQDETIEFLPHDLFRKYIAYAQKYVNPQLSDGAKIILKEFYLHLRKQFQTGDNTPVTIRQLHSLIRLTQARAKVELREEATEADAQDVVDIMKRSLTDIFSDGAGMLDSTRSQNGTGMSTRNQAVKLLTLLQRTSEEQMKCLFSSNEIQELSERVGIPKHKFHNILDSLNIQGYLLYKGSKNYRLVSA